MERIYALDTPVRVMIALEDNPGDFPYVEWMGDHVLYRDSMYSLAFIHGKIQRHSTVIATTHEFDEVILYLEENDKREERKKGLEERE